MEVVGTGPLTGSPLIWQAHCGCGYLMARVRAARPDAMRQFNPGNRAYHRIFNQDYIDAAKPIRQ